MIRQEKPSSYFPVAPASAIRAYTLMEIAIVMVVAGVLLAAFTGAYNVYARERARSQTIANAEEIMEAINRYVMQNGHYPCPAPLNDSYTDDTYGVASGACAVTGSLGFSASEGLFTEQGARTDQVLVDPSAGTKSNNPRVKRGAIPFRTLGLAEKYAYDGYGMRYLYAVTQNLAVKGKFVANAGGIGVYRGTSTASAASVVDPEYSAHFILFSAGPNRMGGYNRYGKQPADATCATGTIDWQNCNTSSSAIYAIAPYSVTKGASYYDDYVRFYTATELPAWRSAGDSGLDIRDSVNAEYGGAVGVGDKKPEVQLSVQGALALRNHATYKPSVFTSRVCNSQGSDCYDVPIAPNAEWDCTSSYIVGFEKGKPKCATLGSPVTDTSPGLVRCPAGQYLRSVNADGTLDCAGTVVLKGCPRKTIDLCYNEDTADWTRGVLDSKPSGGSSTATHSSVSRQATYNCTNGEWELASGSPSGICGCTPVTGDDGVRFYSCDQGYYLDSGTWPSPGGRYKGSIKATFTRSCTGTPPSSATENLTLSNTCSCDDSVETKETRVVPCPNGDKSYIEERTWSCPTATAGQWSAWTNVTSPSVCNSSCTGRMDREEVACPVGYNGTYTRERELTTSCSWQPWSPSSVPTSCTASANCKGALQVRNIGCDGSAGSILQVRSLNCATGAFGSWSTLSSCSSTYRWRANETTDTKVDNADLPSPYYELNDNTGCSASASEAGARKTCYYTAGSGMSWKLNCTCE